MTMCQNKECPIKKKCYRYRAKPSLHQMYGAFVFKNGCEHFIKFWEDKENLFNTRELS